jgi:hypothetical protein
MNSLWVTIIILLVFGGFLILYFLLRKNKEKGFLHRGMNLALFLVTVPQQKIEKEKEISLEEYLKIAEQFFSSLAGIQEKSSISRFLIGNPALVFEIAVPQIGEEIYFYIACPRPIAQQVEKEILGFWPRAQIQAVADYNIFNPTGSSTGSEAFLAKSPILPLKSAKEFGADPLSSMTSVFTKLAAEGEGAAIQILIRPSQRPIKRQAQNAINLIKNGEKLEEAIRKTGGGNVLAGSGEALGTILFSKPKEKEQVQKPPPTPEAIAVQQNIISAIDNKISQPLFDVNLRILASAQNEPRAKEILGQLQGAFDQFSSPVLNQIRFKKLSRGQLNKLFYRFSFRIFDEGKVLTLSSGEVANIYHLPSPALLTPHIKWLKTKQAPPPTNLSSEGIIIGKNIFRGEEAIVRMQEDDRRRHFYVIGQTGTGKSVLLQEMIRQDIESGAGVALIDPHGDLAEKVLGLVPPSRIEDVIYFNPGEIERPLGLNMLEYDPNFPESKTFVVNELIEIFEKLYNLKAMGFGGPVFEQYMRNSLLLVMEDPESGSTLIEIPRVLADKNFRKYKLSKCANIIVKNFWELEAEKAGGEAALANMVPYITSKMNIFIANDLVRPIIAQQVSSFKFREIMDQGKILIINLSKGKLGDINSYLLGMIIVGKLLIATFSRADLPEEKRKDFYLYIDEFHNVTTKTITAALAEARKYRLNMVFSHQFIGQLDEDTRKAIFGNVGSMLTFRVGPDDAKYLVTEYAPVFDENDLVNLDNYNAGLKLLIKGETSKPFNIVTFPPTKENQEVKDLIKKYSQTKYGRDRSQVESELHQKLQKSFGIATPGTQPPPQPK